MSNTDVDLVKGLVQEVSSGARPYSRGTLSYCYFEELRRRGASEAATVSEKWIDYLWSRLSGVPFDRLAKASRSDDQLARLLMEKIGK